MLPGVGVCAFQSPGASLSAGANLSTGDQWKPGRFWCREDFQGWWGVEDPELPSNSREKWKPKRRIRLLSTAGGTVEVLGIQFLFPPACGILAGPHGRLLAEDLPAVGTRSQEPSTLETPQALVLQRAADSTQLFSFVAWGELVLNG